MFTAQSRWFREFTVTGTLLRLAAASVLWLVLTAGDLQYWGLALIAIAGGAVASLALVPRAEIGLSPLGLARFVPFFLIQSVLGGVDVALRAIAPRPRIDPVWVDVTFRVEPAPARVMVANTMSLMPGTLSVSLEGDRLRMHVLDRSMPASARAREVEEHVARMFRIGLPG